MAIESFTISGEKDYYAYDALIGRIASVEFESDTGTLKFKNESGAVKFSVGISSIISSFNEYLDSTLTEANKPAEAKAVGDAINLVANRIPSVDNSLSIANQAADAKKTGDKITAVENRISALEESVTTLVSRNPVLTIDSNGIIDVGYDE